MNALNIFVIAATVIFALAILIQSLTKLKFCAICVTVSSSWIILLLMYFLTNLITNPIIIAVLMGESVIGLYYLLEKKVPTTWQLFRWPYIVTMTTAVCVILGLREKIMSTIILVSIIWIIYLLIYFLRNYPIIKKIIQRLIACCRDW